jgi:hypothetical protein
MSRFFSPPETLAVRRYDWCKMLGALITASRRDSMEIVGILSVCEGEVSRNIVGGQVSRNCSGQCRSGRHCHLFE